MVILKAIKYRIYPTKAQADAGIWTDWAGELERAGNGQKPQAGKGYFGRRVGRVQTATDIQSRLERWNGGRSRPLLPIQQTLFHLSLHYARIAAFDS